MAFIEFFNWFYGWNLWPIIEGLVILTIVVFPIAIIAAIWDKWFRRDS